MMMNSSTWTCALVMALALNSIAAESYMKGKAFYAADFGGNKVAKVEADGKVSWKESAKNTGDLWVWSTSVLFADGGKIREISFDGKNIFEYNSGNKSEIYGCQKLTNGNYLAVECSLARLSEIKPDGTVDKQIYLQKDKKAGGHMFMRNARKTEKGTYLVAQLASGAVEYDADGNVIWQFSKADAKAYAAVRLKNGNTMISFGENDKAYLAEVAPDKQIVWSLTNKDLENQTTPAVNPLKFLTGFFLLPNGNIVLCSWVGHGFTGKAPHLFEVTREKKIVWEYADHQNFKAIGSIFVLDEKGQPLDGNGVH
jgi:hypothetical protein